MSYDSISGKTVIAGRHAKKSSSTKTYQEKDSQRRVQTQRRRRDIRRDK